MFLVGVASSQAAGGARFISQTATMHTRPCGANVLPNFRSVAGNVHVEAYVAKEGTFLQVMTRLLLFHTLAKDGS